MRTIVLYKDYFRDFVNKLSQKEKDKISWTLKLIQSLEIIPKQYFKHIAGTEGIYEIRVDLTNRTSRIFCFFDDGKLIILCNGFIKKTQKTPSKELKKAIDIKKDYFYEKNTDT